MRKTPWECFELWQREYLILWWSLWPNKGSMTWKITCFLHPNFLDPLIQFFSFKEEFLHEIISFECFYFYVAKCVLTTHAAEHQIRQFYDSIYSVAYIIPDLLCQIQIYYARSIMPNGFEGNKCRKGREWKVWYIW